ncbi:hypothetical protein [Phascolarctobacterium sp.]
MTLEQYLAEEKQLAERRAHQSQLQGIGWKNAIAAKELKPGQHIIYNYGLKSLILAVEQKGIKSVIVTTLAENGNQYSRRYKSTSLVAVEELN